MILLQADPSLFLGRFHPLAVHLPIGFLLLAVLLFTLSFFKNYAFLLRAFPIILFLGAISSVVAALLGWLLATEGGYPEATLQWHQWLGISVAVISSIGWLWIYGSSFKMFFSKGKSLTSPNDLPLVLQARRRKIGLVMTLLLILISTTGHLGGNLTHGDRYLIQYAPTFIQTLLADDEKNLANQLALPLDPDSTLLFQHLIEPILIKKCASCHNESKMKGGLLLTTREGLLKGGENGVVLEKGSSQNSELFKRVCLDPTNKKFMPPKGSPMSYTEIALLNYWITSGMSFQQTITDENIPEEIQVMIQQGYSLSTKRTPYIEKEKVPEVAGTLLDSIRMLGFKIHELAEGNNFLEVVSKDSLSMEKIKVLVKIRKQIAWLDLGNTGLKDSWIRTIDQFTNITRLSIDNNSISDDGISWLGSLAHLECINLHATGVTDMGLKFLAKNTSLKRIYAWQTKVTQQTVDSIHHKNPQLVIDLGIDTTKNITETVKAIK